MSLVDLLKPSEVVKRMEHWSLGTCAIMGVVAPAVVALGYPQGMVVKGFVLSWVGNMVLLPGVMYGLSRVMSVSIDGKTLIKVFATSTVVSACMAMVVSQLPGPVTTIMYPIGMCLLFIWLVEVLHSIIEIHRSIISSTIIVVLGLTVFLPLTLMRPRPVQVEPLSTMVTPLQPQKKVEKDVSKMYLDPIFIPGKRAMIANGTLLPWIDLSRTTQEKLLSNTQVSIEQMFNDSFKKIPTTKMLMEARNKSVEIFEGVTHEVGRPTIVEVRRVGSTLLVRADADMTMKLPEATLGKVVEVSLLFDIADTNKWLLVDFQLNAISPKPVKQAVTKEEDTKKDPEQADRN